LVKNPTDDMEFVDPTVTNNFITVAFRFTHSMIQGKRELHWEIKGRTTVAMDHTDYIESENLRTPQLQTTSLQLLSDLLIL
jgi:hypothetical protein